jgi:hypothetical protein
MLNAQGVFKIAAGSVGLLVSGLIARNDALGSVLPAIGGVALVVSGFWFWSK